MEFVSGLAGDIRGIFGKSIHDIDYEFISAALTASEQYELVNYTEARAIDLIKNAFGTPLEFPTEMIRVCFIFL